MTELRSEGRLQRLIEERVIDRFLKCGDPHHGFARIYCPNCRHDFLLAFSCKARYFCPSCHQKRVLAYGDWVEENVLAPVPHRQYVFTVPRMLRPIFSRRRGLLGELCHIVEHLLISAYCGAAVEGRPGLILFVQTFGDLVTFNPHIHVLAADGLFRADGVFVALPAIPVRLLEQGFRCEVLKLLVAEHAIGERLSASMLAWRHSGFSVHNAVRARAGDAEARKKLAQYMLRAPFSLEKMTYLPETGMVMYRSHMHKGLKRNFQLLPGAQWLELLCRHIPDRFEHLVRYIGWYSTRCRGERARAAAPAAAVQAPEDGEVIAARARSAWARLIHKVYEVDSLVCAECGTPASPSSFAAGLIYLSLLGSPWGVAVFSFLAFAAGALVPLLPFLVLACSAALPISIAATALSLFTVGAVISLFTGRSVWRDGLRMLAIGTAAGGLTFAIGKLLGVSMS